MLAFSQLCAYTFDPPHEKIRILPMPNIDTDQRCSNCTADQRLCFCYKESTIPVLLISKI